MLEVGRGDQGNLNFDRLHSHFVWSVYAPYYVLCQNGLWIGGRRGGCAGQG